MTGELLLKQGTRFLVSEDIETDALTSWDAAYTGSEHCVVPKGTVLRVLDDVRSRGRTVHYRRKKDSLAELPYITFIDAAMLDAIPELRADLDGDPYAWEMTEEENPSGFACVPENYDELHPQLIPEATRDSPKYGGFYLVMLFDQIGSVLTPVASG